MALKYNEQNVRKVSKVTVLIMQKKKTKADLSVLLSCTVLYHWIIITDV